MAGPEVVPITAARNRHVIPILPFMEVLNYFVLAREL